MNTKSLSGRFRRADKIDPPRAAEAPQPAKTEPSSPEVTAPEPAKAPPEIAATEPKDGVAPPLRGSRLIEGERTKPADLPRFDFAAARAWSAAQAGRVRANAAPLAIAAALLVTGSAGFTLGHSRRQADGEAASAARWLDATADLRGTGAEVARLTAEMKAVRATVEAQRTERASLRTDLTARQAQLGEKLDRSGQEMAARVARLAETVDKVEKALRDPARLAAFTEKLERIERGLGGAPIPPAKPVAAAPQATPPAAAADVRETGSIGEPKPLPDPRKSPVEGYFVRDYDEGFALVETKAGRFIEVAVGYTVPGIGRVEAIERRGRQWVVVTPKGYIGER